MIGVITRKFYGSNMHWPSDIMTSGHSNMLRKWKDWNTNCERWVVFRRSLAERVVWMKRLVLWCIREVGSSRSMIWKRFGRVSNLVESPYSSSTKAPGFPPMPIRLHPPSPSGAVGQRRKVWRNPGWRRRMREDQSTGLELMAMTLFPTPVSSPFRREDYMERNILWYRSKCSRTAKVRQ